MEIKELAAKLEEKINEKLIEFNRLGKEIKTLQDQIDQHVRVMADIYQELTPVHTLVHISNPQMETLGKDVVELSKKKEKQKGK